MAGLLVGVFVFFVALPIAISSPYPTPSRQDWATASAVPMVSSPSFQLASAVSIPVPKLGDRPASVAPAPKLSDRLTDALPAPQEELAPVVRTASLIIFRRDDASPPAAPAALPPVSDETIPAEDVQSEPAVEDAKIAPQAKRDTALMSAVDAYLWDVYQRQPTKKDRTGDFTWKDPAAAKRVGRTLQAYVIMGMDPDLRETLYHAGKAMDAVGIEWTIVSAFRDDYRQSIAAGLKARTGYSRHGGSRATGGYGHGLAVDIGHADGKSHQQVWRWIDMNGGKYGISRPIRHFDPPHVEPRGNWRRIARNLRTERAGIAVAEAQDRDDAARPAKAKTRTAYNSRRSVRGRRR